MRIRMFSLLLAAGALGCGEESVLPVTESRMAQTRGKVSAEDVISVQDGQRRARVERILGRNLREVPCPRRYGAVLKKAADLWEALEGMMDSEAPYVILTSARFQKEIEDELSSSVTVPSKGVEMPSVLRCLNAFMQSM